MLRTRKKSISLLVALAFVLTLVLPMGAALAQTSNIGQYPYGFSSGYQDVTPGEDQEAGYAAVRLPEDPDIDRYADEVLVSVSLPDGVLYMAPASDISLDEYVTVWADVYGVGEEDITTDVELVSATREALEILVPAEDLDLAQPLSMVVRFNFNGTDSSLEIEDDFSGDLKVTMEYAGFDDGATIFSDDEDLRIARVAAEKVTVTAAAAKTVAVGSARKAAKITIEEGKAGTLAGKTVDLEIMSDGATFNEDDPADVTCVRYASVDDADDLVLDEDNTLLTFDIPDQTVAWPGRIEIVPYLDITPDADEEIQILVTVSGGLASETVTVANVSEAVSFAITDVANTGGKITAGHDAAILKQAGKEAELTIEPVGTSLLPAGMVYVEISGAKFDKTAPFVVSNGNTVKTYNDNKAAYFALDGDEKDVTLDRFNVSAIGEAAAGDIVLTFSSNVGDFDPAEVVIGQVVKPFEVSASAVPEIPYLGQEQAAGDIVITETGKGAIIDDFRLVLPDGVTFAAKPKVEVTAGNIDVKASLEDGGKYVLVEVTDTSSVVSTITISDIEYDVNRLALEGDVEVALVGDPDTEEDSPLWAEQVLATVVNAKVVSEAAGRTAVFTIGSTTYTVNGTEYTMDVAPYIKGDRTFLPVRYVAYALGVSEDSIFYSNGVVSILKGDRAIQMTIGSKTMIVNGVAVTMDVAPEIQAGRTMLPFRWIATALGASVSWDDATKTVTVNL